MTKIISKIIIHEQPKNLESIKRLDKKIEGY